MKDLIWNALAITGALWLVSWIPRYMLYLYNAAVDEESEYDRYEREVVEQKKIKSGRGRND